MLARHLDGTITAVDLLPEMIEELEARMRRAGLDDRVTALVGSMDDLPFRDGEFDIIWAEGSIYNIGFERGLAEWRRFLQAGGVIAVTECSWLSGARLPESKFIRENFPDIDTPSAKIRILEETGYAPAGAFRASGTLLDGELLRSGGRPPSRLSGGAEAQPAGYPLRGVDAGGGCSTTGTTVRITAMSSI